MPSTAGPTRAPSVHYTTTATHAATKTPVVIKLEIPDGKPELVKNIVDKVKEGLASPTASPSHAPVYVSVTASVTPSPSPSSSASTPSPSSDSDNYFDSQKNIPQSLYESIQQVIAQHLYHQQISPSASSPQASLTSSSTAQETSTSAAPTTQPPTQPPTTITSESTHAILEQIPYNYYWHANVNDSASQVAAQWPYMQAPWYGNPYAAYYPQPVYAPSPAAPTNQTQQFFPYAAYPGPYQPQWPTGNYSAYGPGWYEWPYVQPGSAPAQQQNTSTTSNIDNHRLSSFYISTTVTTVVPTTEAPSTARGSYKFADRLSNKSTKPTKRPVTLQRWTTTPAPTTLSEAITEAFDLLRSQAAPNAPQIQVYIVNGPNGTQVQTKTVNSKEGQKQPNVQVYVIDENSKDKTPKPHNNYYQYNYQTDESQINRQTTALDDKDGYHMTQDEDEKTTASPYMQPLPASKAQTLKTLYNAGDAGLKNFTENSVPETACTRAGLFQHPNDCNKFYECYYDRFLNKYALHMFECPVKLAFDSRIVGCNGPNDPTVCIQY